MDDLRRLVRILSHPRVANVLLILVVLALITVTRSWLSPKTPERVTPRPSAPAAASDARLRPPQRPASEYQVIYDEDIFTGDRRPPEAITPPPPSPPTPTPPLEAATLKGFKLRGVLSFGRFKKVFVEGQKVTSGKAVPYGVGDKIGDFTVTDIRATEVHVASGDQEAILHYDRFGLFPEGEMYTSDEKSILEKFQDVDETREVVFQQLEGGALEPVVKTVVSGVTTFTNIPRKPEYTGEHPYVEEGGKKYIYLSGSKQEYVPPSEQPPNYHWHPEGKMWLSGGYIPNPPTPGQGPPQDPVAISGARR